MTFRIVAKTGSVFFLITFLVSIAMGADSASKTKSLAGVAYSRDLTYPVFADELGREGSYAPILFALGAALDKTAQDLLKFPKVPQYRITRVVRGLLDTVREKPEDSVLVLFERIRAQLAAQCEGLAEGEPCLVRLHMSSDDWGKPLPNWRAAAKPEDIASYDDKFIATYFREIDQRIEELSARGYTTVFGHPLHRDTASGAMSAIEKAEMKKQVVELYKKFWLSQKFVETPLGWFWAEPLNTNFIEYPWGDVAIRARKVPATYQEFLGLIEQGLNQYYIRQKREEIFSSYLAFHNNDLIKTTEGLLEMSGFQWFGRGDSHIVYGEMKTRFLDYMKQLKTEKSELVARMTLMQSLVARMDRKSELYDPHQRPSPFAK